MTGNFHVNGVQVSVIASDTLADIKNKINRGEDINGNGVLDLNEVTHTGRVIEVDSEGNTIKVIGKFGQEGIFIHHPAARQVEARYGPMRAYFRD